MLDTKFPSGSQAGASHEKHGSSVGDGELSILEALASEPSLSQRELARRAGLSLTKAHFILRRLVEKGLVTVQNVATSNHKLGYLYLLTDKGHEQKARLTYAFLHRMASQYRDMLSRVQGRLDQGLTQHSPAGSKQLSVAVVGKGALADVVANVLGARPGVVLAGSPESAELLVVVDPESAGSFRTDVPRIQLG